MSGFTARNQFRGQLAAAAMRVIFAEAVLEDILQAECFLREKSPVRLGALQNSVHHAANARRRRDLDGRPQPAGNDLRIDFIHVVFFTQFAILYAGYRSVNARTASVNTGS